MEVLLTGVFSAIIIFITVFFLIKILFIAYKRNEISRRKLIVYSISCIVIGVTVASLLPFGFQKLYGYLYLQINK
jgi:ABC-type uncharacterized transport system YnjBCD permease subunit